MSHTYGRCHTHTFAKKRNSLTDVLGKICCSSLAYAL